MQLAVDLRFTMSLHNVFIYFGIYLLFMIDKNVNGTMNGYKQCSDDMSCTHEDDSPFNINLNLQKQTREVVMMKELPRIHPVKVCQSSCNFNVTYFYLVTIFNCSCMLLDLIIVSIAELVLR